MTKQKISIARQFCVSEGVYMPVARSSNKLPQYLKEVVCTILSQNEIDTLKILCCRKTKLTLLNSFWNDDFNYLGTRIKIISEQNMIDSFETKRMNMETGELVSNILICRKDNSPLGLIEYV